MMGAPFSVMRINHIVAMDRNGVIGKNGKLPWRNSADLKHFKETTMNRAIVMGRKTFDSLPCVLPGRLHIVITRNPNIKNTNPRVKYVSSIEEAIAKVMYNHETISTNEMFIIGGGEIFSQTMNLADMLYITKINTTVLNGDTKYPSIDLDSFTLISETPLDAAASLCIYIRKGTRK